MAESSLTRYRRVVAAVLEERGAFCEVCGEPSRHCHHIIPVSETGIASELVYEKANMMILCSDCHALMHPGQKNRNMWWIFDDVSRARGRSLSRGR